MVIERVQTEVSCYNRVQRKGYNSDTSVTTYLEIVSAVKTLLSEMKASDAQIQGVQPSYILQRLSTLVACLSR